MQGSTYSVIETSAEGEATIATGLTWPEAAKLCEPRGSGRRVRRDAGDPAERRCKAELNALLQRQPRLRDAFNFSPLAWETWRCCFMQGYSPEAALVVVICELARSAAPAPRVPEFLVAGG